MKYGFGVDLGGTNIAAGLVNEEYKIVSKLSVPTGADRGAEAIVADIAALCHKMCATNNIDMSGTDEDKDLLGRTYEYCIQQFAAYEGTKGGEFYTPQSIVKTIVEVLKPFELIRGFLMSA